MERKTLDAATAAKYWAANVKISTLNRNGIMIGVENHILHISFGGVPCTFGLHECQLILTTLSKISEEHAREVAKILDDQSSPELFDFDTFQEWMDEIFTNNSASYADYVSGDQFRELIDFLRSKFYDLDGLIEAGITIEETI